jgi:hypothetical protein
VARCSWSTRGWASERAPSRKETPASGRRRGSV